MKITKFTHSCLFIEENNISVLIDPGKFSIDAGLSADMFSNLDYLIITHEHFDHFDIPFIKGLKEKFPDLQILSCTPVVDILAKENILASHSSNNIITLSEQRHENIFGVATPPMNACITLFSRLLHPGDSLQFETTPEILALPMQAPWGNTTQILEKAYTLKPKLIIPIHDWHWRDEARKGIYTRAVDYFKENNITFIPLENTVPYTIE